MLLASCGSIHTVRWANAFTKLGHEVHLLTLLSHKTDKDAFDPNVFIHYLTWSGSKGYYLNVFQVRKYFNSIRPDIVNVHYASGYGTLARLAHLHPCVLSVWGSDIYDFPKISFIHSWIIRKNLLYADALASTSHVMAEQIRKVLKNPNKEIKITPFGVDIAKFNPTVTMNNKANDSFVFGVIKKLTSKYGINYIIDAFNLFLARWKSKGAQGKKPTLFICGKGDGRDQLIKQRDNLGLQEYVTIEGYVPHEQVPSLFRSFDVACYGSVSESFGVAAVEAMSCGIPVIATNVDGFKEVMVDKVTGFIVPKRDPRAMAEKMWLLYNDNNLRAEYGRNGRKRVEELYDWDKNVLELESLLKKNAKA